MASSVIEAGSVEQDKTFAFKKWSIQTPFFDINDDSLERLRLGFHGGSNLCFITPSDRIDELRTKSYSNSIEYHGKNLTVLLPAPVGPITLHVKVIRRYIRNYFLQPQLTE